MATTSSIATAEDLLKMPRDGSRRYELVRGELRSMSPSGSQHVVVAANIITRLSQHVQAHDLGVVFGCEGGFLIARDPDTGRAPDVAFVRKTGIPTDGIPAGFWDGPPDLAVEVISPSDTLIAVEEKVDDWIAAGTKVVWVVNPQRRTVSVHGAGCEVTVLRENETLGGGELIPGFECRIGDFLV